MIKHHFSAGVYVREMTLAKDHEVTTHKHAYDHFGLLGAGSAVIEVDGELTVHHAPAVIEIKAGKAHRIQALTDITWFCIHATDAADPEQIDEVLIKGSA
jgi:quercetin dioxygenase-like cupin family protein